MSEYKKILAEKEWQIIDLTIENRALRQSNEEYEKIFTEMETAFDRILAEADK